MAASITFSGASLGSIDEGDFKDFTGFADLSLVMEVIQANYPTASPSRTFFSFFLEPELSSVANKSDFASKTLSINAETGLVSGGSIITLDDSQDEPDEAFSFQPVLVGLSIRDASGNRLADLRPPDIADLFAPSGGLTLNLGKFTGTIIDNDDPPINQPPTAVNLLNTITALDENTSTATRIKVADVTVTDDGQGTNFLILSGSDASAFELDGSTLYLKAGTTLDYETKSSYSVIVNTDDVTAGGVIDASNTFTLSVNDLVENTAPTATGETVSTSKNTAVTVELGDNVTDAETLTGATLNVTSSSNGTASIDQDARLVTFTPAAGFSGTASFNYTITDAGGLTSTAATVTVEVGDILTTGNKDQNIQGNNGNDSISAGNGKDIIQGFGGNDTLLGNNGADRIDGGTGDDLINGGNGPDLLTGGSGRDRFVLTKSAGGDTIADFADGADWIALSGLSFGQLSITASGSNTLIKLGSETLATLTGVNSSLITAADFVTV